MFYCASICLINKDIYLERGWSRREGKSIFARKATSKFDGRRLFIRRLRLFEQKKKPLTKKSEKESDTNLENVKLDLSKLSRREKVRLFERECPEFSLIVGEFNVRMEEIGQIYQPLVELMQKGVIPGNGPAAEYIKMKHQIAIK